MTFLPSDHTLGNHMNTPFENDRRKINYLRISLTDRCNLACMYCVPKGSIPSLPHKDIASYEEILKITSAAVELGITKVRITGGEPLVRKGLTDFLKELSKIDEIKDIAITTNGVLLVKYLDELIDSGLKRLNISLDTLKPEKFKFITGKDRFNDVWNGIMAAFKKGINPIKLNTVSLRGVNDDEIEDLAAITTQYPFHIRFIEYMPMGNSAVDIGQQILIPEIRTRIESKFGELEPVKRGIYDGPAKRFKIKGGIGEIGFISPVSSHFCKECNRLRLTSTGMLRPCLLNKYEKDILKHLRNGASDEELKEIIREVIINKPLSHHLEKNSTAHVESQMSKIGG